jgi:flavodoxin short chain
MSKVAVVYWSGTGNTQAMAEAVAEGAKSSGAEVSVFEASGFTAQQVGDFDGIAFGCPAMGDEVLEEGSFEPVFTDAEKHLSGKPVALFGSYGWGGGAWMESWAQRTRDDGAKLFSDGLIVENAPGDAELADCRKLGEDFVKSL